MFVVAQDLSAPVNISFALGGKEFLCLCPERNLKLGPENFQELCHFLAGTDSSVLPTLKTLSPDSLHYPGSSVPMTGVITAHLRVWIQFCGLPGLCLQIQLCSVTSMDVIVYS